MIKFLNPYYFNKLINTLLPFIAGLMIIVMSYGLYQALIVSPEDYQQGEMVRVMYIHVPAAWMSLGVYSFMAACSFSNLVWRTKMSYILAVASAPIGTMFALITLVTGSIWGKPIWGTWWVWDARLTSMLILFLFYLCYIAVVASGDNLNRAEKPASVIALVGFINVPIVKFSVDIWYSLHQGASVLSFKGPAIHSSMMLPLMVMFAGFILYYLTALLMRTSVLLKINIKQNQRIKKS